MSFKGEENIEDLDQIEDFKDGFSNLEELRLNINQDNNALANKLLSKFKNSTKLKKINIDLNSVVSKINEAN